jgi:hypothetical protein
MDKSLEEFLGVKKRKEGQQVTGSMECQECEEIVAEAHFDGTVIQYVCSQGHLSEIKI